MGAFESKADEPESTRTEKFLSNTEVADALRVRGSSRRLPKSLTPSPRASAVWRCRLACGLGKLARTARARAFLEGRGFVTPQDVKAVGTMVLRHRVLTTYEAEAEGVDSEAVLRQVFDTVPVP